jgi:hypothetical protein
MRRGQRESLQSVPRRRRPVRRSIRAARFAALAGLVLIGLLYYRPIKAYLDARHSLATRTAEIRTLRSQQLSLQRRLTATRGGATLLANARRLGLVKPGERLFIVTGIGAWRRAHATH